ncbi:MAG: chromosome segregation protein SMC [Oscillospiraceae bacterium]|nr:chromosome segregation protein SMC [Oscillospiraceae bacterium]
MYLKYVEIQGFKSFPDKTRLSFGRGLTGIVGPNGSGKSNISDAVKWVLGEQSTKSLRGGKMEDVIFSGTPERNPMGFAQVSICLDNSDSRIADVGEEITVTRRFYRSGDSEYMLNGSPVRLRDLREMFMDTGLGRDGYSVIGQGRIAEVVESRSADRREVFEEASGIAKFRFRKTEAERKLVQTEDNLSRLRDIAGELESRVGPLKEQSEKAKKFLEYSDERKKLEITLYSDTIKRSRENISKEDEKIEIARLDYRGLDERFQSIGTEIEELYENSRAAGTRSTALTSDIDERNAKIASIEAGIAVLRNDIMHGERDIRELEDDIASLSEGDTGIQKEITSRLAEAQQREDQAAAVADAIAGLEKDLEILAQDTLSTDRMRAERLERLTALQKEIADLRVETVASKSVIETMDERENFIRESLPAELDRLEDRSARLKETEEYISNLDIDISAKENSARGYELRLASRNEKLSQAADKAAACENEIERMIQRMNLLSDLESSNEGYQPPVRRVLAAREEKRLRGIVGTVGSLLTVGEGLETAIETALGAAIQNIVVDDERSAKSAIGFLRDSRAGRATFLPLDTVTPRRFEHRERLADAGVIGVASELVSCDEKYRSAVDSLLGNVLVVEDLDYASAIARKTGYRVRIVTRDGQIINAGGSYTGGSVRVQAGMFSRRTEIEELEKKIAERRKDSETLKNELEAARTEASRAQAELTAVTSELVTAREDRIRAESAADRLRDEIEALKNNAEAASAELDSIDSTRQQRQSEIDRNGAKSEALESEARRLEEQLTQDDSSDGVMEKRTGIMQQLTERRVERAELLKDAERARQSAEDLRLRGSESLGRLSNLQETIESIKAENEDRLSRIRSAEEEEASVRKEIDEIRADIARSGELRDENDRRTQELRSEQDSISEQREKIASEISRLEERKTALQNDYNSAVNRLWEEYELSVAEALPLCVEFSSVTELRQQVSSVRNRIRALGNVNVAAIEEYQEVSSRYEFMSEQIADVDESRRTLLKLIDDLEREMKQIFTRSFNEINEKFHYTFKMLFGGGHANLFLTDENDILESGIELDVQPPGKVIKSLSLLSGGEKAMVAIAIYMAILEVNPSPFCILDEIDSALDENNVIRFARYAKTMTDRTQMIAITHKRGTMEEADVLYGITMQEEGVSKVLRLSVEEARLVLEKEENGRG